MSKFTFDDNSLIFFKGFIKGFNFREECDFRYCCFLFRNYAIKYVDDLDITETQEFKEIKETGLHTKSVLQQFSDMWCHEDIYDENTRLFLDTHFAYGYFIDISKNHLQTWQ